MRKNERNKNSREWNREKLIELIAKRSKDRQNEPKAILTLCKYRHHWHGCFCCYIKKSHMLETECKFMMIVQHTFMQAARCHNHRTSVERTYHCIFVSHDTSRP